jgi:hypothetical protein
MASWQDVGSQWRMGGGEKVGPVSGVRNRLSSVGYGNAKRGSLRAFQGEKSCPGW